MDIFLDPESGRPLVGQLYEQLRLAITGGRLLPGDRLVPSRPLAGELGVSRHTVTTAYGRLVAEGYAEGHSGGGSVVASASPAPPRGRARRPPLARAGGSQAGRRISGRPRTAAVSIFRPGLVDPALFPAAMWRRRVAAAVAAGTSGVRRPSREDQAAAGHRRLGSPVAIGGGRKTRSWSPAAPSMRSTWSPGSCLSPATVSRSRIPGMCQWCACSALSARGSLAYPSMTRAWSWIYCRPQRASCTSRPRINFPSA